MNNLLVGLGIAAGLALAGVVAYNAWMTRRAGEQIKQADSQLDDAPPMPGERVEPAFGHASEVPGAAAHKPAGGGFSVSSFGREAQQRFGLDALIDAIAPLAIDGPVSGDAVLAALPPTRRAGTKPFSIEGQPEGGAIWETPQAGRRYHALQAGVQLANRAGALNEIEFSEFVQKAQAFADSIDATPQLPDMREQVARARELDQFAAAHDAQLGFTLRSRGAAWSPGYIMQHAARLGFVAGALPGRLVVPSTVPGSAPILELTFDTQAALAEDPSSAAVRDLRLALDVAHVPRPEQPFVRMRDAAIALAAGMDGLITDDSAQVIRPEALDGIGADLETLYDTLVQREFAAGSMLARRLFS